MWPDIAPGLMRQSPIAHHLARDLARIAEWRGIGLYDLMPALARAAARILRLIWTHASAAVAALTLLHDLLSDAVVRQMLQRFGPYTGKVRIVRRRLRVGRSSSE
jgi:hypothetical protein